MIWKVSLFLVRFTLYLYLYLYLFGYLVYHKPDFKAISLTFCSLYMFIYRYCIFLLVCQWQQQHAFCIEKIHTELGLGKLHECMSMLCHLHCWEKNLIKYTISQSSCIQAPLMIVSPHVCWMQVEHEQDSLVWAYSLSLWNR